MLNNTLASRFDSVLYEMDLGEMAKRKALKRLTQSEAIQVIDVLEITEALMAWCDQILGVVHETWEQLEKPIACDPGCAFCCNLMIYANPPELLTIEQYLSIEKDSKIVEETRARVQARVGLAKDLNSEKWTRSQIGCSMLVDGMCSIYPVRPFGCRGWVSEDVELCKRVLSDPENTIIEGGLTAWVAFEIERGLRGALQEVGLDDEVVELNTGLDTLFQDPGKRERWVSGGEW